MLLDSAEGSYEDKDKTRSHGVESDLIHLSPCFELAVTFRALDLVVCLVVLNGRQQMIAKWKEEFEPEPLPPASRIPDGTRDTLASDGTRRSAEGPYEDKDKIGNHG